MNPDPVAFQIFGQNIYWYGILISAGILLGIILAMRNAKIFGLDQDAIVDLALLVIPLAIVGARLYYVVFEWDQYKDNLIDIINIRKGGLAIYGGVIGGVIGGLIFARRKKLDFWNLADICAPSLILGQAIGRWGNYINQEAYGKFVGNPEWQWFPAAVFIEKADPPGWYMATFFYESFWNFIVFFILMSYRKHRKKTGEVFLLYLILYSAGRFFIEGLRTDSLYIGSIIRVSKLLSAVLFAAATAVFIYRRKHSTAEIPETDDMSELKDTSANFEEVDNASSTDKQIDFGNLDIQEEQIEKEEKEKSNVDDNSAVDSDTEPKSITEDGLTADSDTEETKDNYDDIT